MLYQDNSTININKTKIIFFGFSFLLINAFAFYFNESGFYWLNSVLSTLPDTLLVATTNLGDAWLIAPFIFVIWLAKKEYTGLWALIITTILLILIVQGFKQLTQNDRPGGVLELDTFSYIGRLLNIESWPSGHTSSAFASAVLLSYFFPRFKIIFALLAMSVGLSRIGVGAHWPFDVTAGIGFGVSIALVSIYLAKKIPANKILNITVSILSLAIMSMSFTHKPDFPEWSWLYQIINVYSLMFMVLILMIQVFGKKS
jgi:membrane-associated phospholipid phosphatase